MLRKLQEFSERCELAIRLCFSFVFDYKFFTGLLVCSVLVWCWDRGL